MVQPKDRFRVGNVTTTLWENEVEVNGEKRKSLSVSTEKSYKDKDGDWKNTSSLNVNEIPKAILSLQRAFDEIYNDKKDDENKV